MSVQSSAVTKRKTKELGFWQKVWRQRQLVVLSLPVLMVIIFSYVPLWGWSFAFFNYKPTTGLNVFANDWIGLQSFQELFTDAYFWRGLKNSLNNVLTVRAELGTQLNELESLDSLGSDRALGQTQQMSDLVDVDWNATISSYIMQQTALQASYKAFTDMQGLSLFQLNK